MAKNNLLTILSDAEHYALYGLPDFDDGQQLEYLSLSEAERALASSRRGFHAQVYCVLQIAYFKAKHAFFREGAQEAQRLRRPSRCRRAVCLSAPAGDFRRRQI